LEYNNVFSESAQNNQSHLHFFPGLSRHVESVSHIDAGEFQQAEQLLLGIINAWGQLWQSFNVNYIFQNLFNCLSCLRFWNVE
jgi:hypothetical protein